MSLSASGIEVKFDHSTTMRAESKCVQNVRNLMVGITATRCFSPTLGDVISPGLSPIFAPDGEGPNGDNNPNFKNFTDWQVSPASRDHQCHSGEFPLSNENASLELELSTSTKSENSLEVSSRSEILSQYSNVLNRTITVTVLLNEIGLGHYSDIFIKAGFDIEKLLNIKLNDLKSLGFQSDDECNAILNRCHFNFSLN